MQVAAAVQRTTEFLHMLVCGTRVVALEFILYYTVFTIHGKCSALLLVYFPRKMSGMQSFLWRPHAHTFQRLRTGTL